MRSEKWLKTLYDANYKNLYRLASHLLYASIGHTSDVQDVLQEVFLLAAREKIYQHPKPEAWLVITTKNLCANFARSSRRQVRKQGRYAQEKLPRNVHRCKAFAEPVCDETHTSDVLLTLKQTLPPEDYDLLYKYCVEDLPVEHLAREMALDPTAVRMRISRIRARLKKIL